MNTKENKVNLTVKLPIVDEMVIASQLYDVLDYNPDNYWCWLNKQTIKHEINASRENKDYFFMSKENSVVITGKYRSNCRFTLPFAKEIVMSAKSEYKKEIYEYLESHEVKNKIISKDGQFSIMQKTFGDLTCDVYKDNAGNIFMTRDQIGQMLEYVNPIDAICKIHTRHAHELEGLYIQTKLKGTDGKFYETILYTTDGIRMIASFSRQPNKQYFIKWVENTKIISTGETNTPNDSVSDKLDEIHEDIRALMNHTTNIENSLPETKKRSVWQRNIYGDVDLLANKKNTTSVNVLHNLYIELENRYGNGILTDTRNNYLFKNNLTDCPMMDAIESDHDVKMMFRALVDEMLEKYHLTTRSTRRIYRTIFDD